MSDFLNYNKYFCYILLYPNFQVIPYNIKLNDCTVFLWYNNNKKKYIYNIIHIGDDTFNIIDIAKYLNYSILLIFGFRMFVYRRSIRLTVTKQPYSALYYGEINISSGEK